MPWCNNHINTFSQHNMLVLFRLFVSIILVESQTIIMYSIILGEVNMFLILKHLHIFLIVILIIGICSRNGWSYIPLYNSHPHPIPHPIPIPPCPHPILIPHPIQTQPWAMGGGHVAAGGENPKEAQWPSRAPSSPPHFHVELRGREHWERAKLLQNFLWTCLLACIVAWSCMLEREEPSFVQIQCLKVVAYIGFEQTPLTIARVSCLCIKLVAGLGFI